MTKEVPAPEDTHHLPDFLRQVYVPLLDDDAKVIVLLRRDIQIVLKVRE